MTPVRWLALWLLMLSACATEPTRKKLTAEPLPTARAVPTVPLQRVSAETSPPPAPSPPANPSAVIGKRDLEEARELLNQARNELEPQQWALLDTRLTEAERAFEAFSVAATASGRAAVVARAAHATAEAGRAGEVMEGLRFLVRAGPLLLLVGALWPSETADTAHDHGPDWNPEELEFKAKLSALAEAGERVKAELAAREAQRGRQGSKVAPSAQPNVIPQEAREGIPEWKRQCDESYRDCINQDWVQKWSCHDCFRYCEGQHKWPDDKCYAPWNRRRSQ